MIQLFNVRKKYGSDTAALTDVNLVVRKGEFVFLTGPSGAGKSTLLRLVFCAEPPTDGRIVVFGRDVARLRPSSVPYVRRAIGVVFQDFKLLPHRTLAENVAFPLHVKGVRPREVEQRVMAALRNVGLDHRASRFPLSLSGGEQQRAAVARALVGEPSLVLADEPTGNLDPDRTDEVLDLLAAANTRGTTVLVATHDRSILARYPRRVVSIESGRIVSDSRPSRLVP